MEAQERVSELSTSNSSMQTAKRKAEQQLATLQVCIQLHTYVLFPYGPMENLIVYIILLEDAHLY